MDSSVIAEAWICSCACDLVIFGILNVKRKLIEPLHFSPETSLKKSAFNLPHEQFEVKILSVESLNAFEFVKYS